MRSTKEDIKFRIIWRLARWKKWGASHTENVVAGLPSHLIGSKATKQALRELERQKWILAAIKTNERHYALNPKKAQEIKQFLEKWSSPTELVHRYS